MREQQLTDPRYDNKLLKYLSRGQRSKTNTKGIPRI